MRILTFTAVLLRYLGIDRFLFSAFSTHAANCVARGDISQAIASLERLERFLYLSRSHSLSAAQYRLASLYEQSSRVQEAVGLYEGLLRRRISITMSGNIRVRLGGLRQGRSIFAPVHQDELTPESGIPERCV